jgi:hypothetical protein
MKQPLARILNVLGVLFPELRARPAHASGCASFCLNEYNRCLSGCAPGNLACEERCAQLYEVCATGCPM